MKFYKFKIVNNLKFKTGKDKDFLLIKMVKLDKKHISKF